MVREIKCPKTDGQWKQELGRVCEALRKKGTKPTMFPTKLTKPEDFLKINALNAHKFDPTGYSKEDLPPCKAFQKAGMDFYNKVYGYLSFKIKEAQSKKRSAERFLDWASLILNDR